MRERGPPRIADGGSEGRWSCSWGFLMPFLLEVNWGLPPPCLIHLNRPNCKTGAKMGSTNVFKFGFFLGYMQPKFSDRLNTFVWSKSADALDWREKRCWLTFPWPDSG